MSPRHVDSHKSSARQIPVRIPQALYDNLRRHSYELHKSQAKIIAEALTLYLDLVDRRKASDMANSTVTETE